MNGELGASFVEAIREIEKSKGIPESELLHAIESALSAAYRKHYGVDQNVRVEVDEETGGINAYSRKDVVEEVEDENTQISLADALEIDERYEINDIIEYQIPPQDFTRIAAQTAKQVVMQKLREIERNMIFDDFASKLEDVVTGTVQRRAGDTLFISLGQTEGILTKREQVPGERYLQGDRIKVYILDVKNGAKGAQVFLSRSHPGLVKRLFEIEVPEIEEGLVEIKGIAREAGARTKMAVYTEDENIDPVGACVGSRGNRVQQVVDEIFDEKIDIIPWSEDPVELIKNVLSPAKVEEVVILEDEATGENQAEVIVPDHQLSLAIGRSGQNVRLAAKLSGWKIDINSHSQYYGEDEEVEEMLEVEDVKEVDEVLEAVEGGETVTVEEEDVKAEE
ncbi:MAG: transcription termination factor NusA [Anaerovoracaceae bacterium]